MISASGTGYPSGRLPLRRPPPGMKRVTWRQVPEAFLKACRLPTARAPRCPWQPLVRLSPGIGMVLGAAGREGSRRHRALHGPGPRLPRASSHSSARKGAFLQKNPARRASGFLVGAPGLLPSRPGNTDRERGPGGSSSRKRGPHPGTKPRARGRRRALRTSMATPRREGPGPPGCSAGTWSDNRSRTLAGAEGPPPRERQG